MELTKEYLVQCDCPEIQDSWKPKVGDFIYSKSDYLDIFHDHDCCNGDMCDRPKFNYNEEELESIIWIPRQDQLQDMIISHSFRIYKSGLNDSYHVRVDKYKHQPFSDPNPKMLGEYKWVPDYELITNSMEQLWLAFVMKEKFNKTWNGKEWKHG